MRIKTYVRYLLLIPGSIYCMKHAKPGMINKKHKICIASDCIKRANYSNASFKGVEYCEEHASHEMICKMKI